MDNAVQSEAIALSAADIAFTKAGQVTTDRTVTEQRATDADAARVIAAQKVTDATTAAGTATTQAGIATMMPNNAGRNATAAANAVLSTKANAASPILTGTPHLRLAASGTVEGTLQLGRGDGALRNAAIRYRSGWAAANPELNYTIFASHNGTQASDGTGQADTLKVYGDRTADLLGHFRGAVQYRAARTVQQRLAETPFVTDFVGTQTA